MAEYKGARYINKQVRQIQSLGNADYKSPTLTTTGRQEIPRGALIESKKDHRYGQVRGYKSYRKFVTEEFGKDPTFRPLTEKEYREAITSFVDKYSSYTTPIEAKTPANLFTIEGQDFLYTQKAVYILGKAGVPEDAYLGKTREEINRLFRLTNEIVDNMGSKYDSGQSPNLYYQILSEVAKYIAPKDDGAGELVEGEHYIVTKNKDGTMNYDLTSSGRDITADMVSRFV